MKSRSLLVVLAVFLISSVYAQSLEEGVKMYHYERFQRAIGILEQSVKTQQNDLSAWYWLTRAYQMNNEPAKAETAFKAIPAELKGQPLYEIINGRINLEKGDTVSAALHFSAALGNSRKKNPVIQLGIAEANIELDKGNLYTAIGLLTEASKKDKNNPSVYLAMGDAYRKLYNGSESFRNYQHASDLNSKDPVIYYKIGKIYQTQANAEVFLGYYEKAIKADPDYGQVYYQLYYYYYYKDLAKAFDNLQKFIAHSDTDKRNAYLLTDLYYVSKKYQESIGEAKKILTKEGANANPRLYKLMGYSYDALNNYQAAIENLKTYFEIANDTSYASEDFELMAKLSEQNKQFNESAIWYEKAFLLQKDTAKKASIVKRLIAFNKKIKNYEMQIHWFDQLANLNVTFTNVDIFNWGIASFYAKNYIKADSIFGMYETKYPEQTFGYYWRARSNAAIDTAMETGLAIPHYESLIKVAEKDTLNANNRKWLIQAYGYIAAFKVNKDKLYTDALAYYDKILQLDPANSDAEKYKGILEKMIDTKETDKQK